MKKVSYVGILAVVALLLLACGKEPVSSGNPSQDSITKTEEIEKTETTVVTEGVTMTEVADQTSDSRSKVEITKTIFEEKKCVAFELKNCEEVNLYGRGECEFLDESGEVLGIQNMVCLCIPAGESTLVIAEYESLSIEDPAEVNLRMAFTETKRESKSDQISVELFPNGDRAYWRIQNSSDEDIIHMNLYIGFFDSNKKLIDYIPMNAYDDHNGIFAAKESIYRESTLPKDYSEYRTFVEPSYEDVPEKVEDVTPQSITITRKIWNTNGSTKVYDFLKNETSDTILFYDYLAFCDSDGVVSGVGNSDKLILIGPGETAVYEMSSREPKEGATPIYKTYVSKMGPEEYSLSKKFEIVEKKDGDLLTYTYRNTAEEIAQSVVGYVFLMDENDEIVSVTRKDCWELMSGETMEITVQNPQNYKIMTYVNAAGGGDI